MLDHLGVVIRGQERLALAAVGHRQPAHEVGQPAVRGSLELRVLVQVVVELPRLVADPEVIWFGVDQVVEDHEVVDKDFVHPPPSLESVQVVLGRLGLDMRGLVGQLGAGGMDALALGFKDARDGVLSEPVDFEVPYQRPQFAGDRNVALGMA